MPRPSSVAAATTRSVRAKRSMSGPTTGASRRKGASVTKRYAITRGERAPTDTLKKSDPASETAKNESAKLRHRVRRRQPSKRHRTQDARQQSHWRLRPLGESDVPPGAPSKA